MALSRVLAAWVVVAGWFLIWEAVARQIGRRPTRTFLSGPLWIPLGQALLVTLLGTLWFGSLGAGAWWLVFALVGGIAEWPSSAGDRRPWRTTPRAVAAGSLRVARIVVAGGLLAWRLVPA
ncbi:MAG: hypothetical protein ACREMX_15030 [Gemmatimonadales bacterium]